MLGFAVKQILKPKQKCSISQAGPGQLMMDCRHSKIKEVLYNQWRTFYNLVLTDADVYSCMWGVRMPQELAWSFMNKAPKGVNLLSESQTRPLALSTFLRNLYVVANPIRSVAAIQQRISCRYGMPQFEYIFPARVKTGSLDTSAAVHLSSAHQTVRTWFRDRDGRNVLMND